MTAVKARAKSNGKPTTDNKIEPVKLAEPSHKLAGVVHISAALKRPVSHPDHRYENFMEKLFVHDNGAIYAKSGCTTAFVCTKAEAPEIAAWMTKVAEAKVAA